MGDLLPTVENWGDLRVTSDETVAYTPINSEDRLVQETFEEYLRDTLGWDSVFAWNNETFGPDGTLGRDSEREVVLKRDLRAAIARLNPTLAAKEINGRHLEALLKEDHRFVFTLIQKFPRVIGKLDA